MRFKSSGMAAVDGAVLLTGVLSDEATGQHVGKCSIRLPAKTIVRAFSRSTTRARARSAVRRMAMHALEDWPRQEANDALVIMEQEFPQLSVRFSTDQRPNVLKRLARPLLRLRQRRANDDVDRT